jgi:2-oxoglutarate/2-oxoacid ferredoxin oxidoreductase subunit alpha
MTKPLSNTAEAAGGLRFWDGNRACAEGAIMAGLGFYGGYPITPSTEIAEYLSWRLPQEGGVFMQVEDEIAGLATCLGASQGGAKAMTATSGPGFSLMQENLGFACMAELPVVIVNVQRLGPSTGQPTRSSQGDYMQAVWGTHGDHPIIVVSPSAVQEMLSLTVRAFNLAERYRTPVILLADEVIAHMREAVVLPEPGSLEIVSRKRPQVPPHEYVPYRAESDGVPPMAPFGEGGYRYHVTGLHHDERGFPTVDEAVMGAWSDRVHRKLALHLNDIVAFELITPQGVVSSEQPGARERVLDAVGRVSTLLVSFGAAARAASAAVRLAAEQGYDVALLRLQTLWPLDDEWLAALVARVERVVVVEMNRGQLLREMQRVALSRDQVVGVLQPVGGMIAPSAVMEAIRR